MQNETEVLSSNKLKKFINCISYIFLFLTWFTGITICFSKKKILIEWFIIVFILTIYGAVVIIKNIIYIFRDTNENVNVNLNENEKIKNKTKNKIIIRNLPYNYSDTCPICIEKLENSDVCTFEMCNFHYYHIECMNGYIENGFTHCAICNR